LRERGADVDLIFRKFASDFSDKYKVQPVRLTEEAKEELLKFRFPGNIRQLKNIAEQISVLETNREISKETLRKYLPETHTLPALYTEKSAVTGDGFSERDILYKILFDMKKDMNELKKLVLNLLQGNNFGAQVLKDHKDLFDEITHDEDSLPHEESASSTPLLIGGAKEKKEPYIIHPKIEDIAHETEEESLSLEDKEKEMIQKALKKNNNKRKYAAQDLGISERTLYRKIKQYSIEE
jgi:DNA-binding NtrC family response regulator